MARGIRCVEVCPIWNSYDKDCEIYGEHHSHPKVCYWFHQQHPDLYEKNFGVKKEENNMKGNKNES